MVRNDNNVPELREALRRRSPEQPAAQKPPEEIPPPPGDWTGHPVTRGMLAIILLALIALLAWKTPVWLVYAQDHPFGAGVAAFILIMLVVVVAMVFWRWRAVGDVGMRYWDTERKRRKR